MSGISRSFWAALKARVTNQALRAEDSIQQIAAGHAVNSSQASQRERNATEGLVTLFKRGATTGRVEQEAEIRRLHEKIAQPVIQRDFSEPARYH